ncbi:MAG: hypothetical protein BGO67_02765 [Alphaproteobacteria bacterium 41-28]|nr:MAG: hypothetical protein BGO67_02765 [Alphaproteobacteria bacterium 41-28]
MKVIIKTTKAYEKSIEKLLSEHGRNEMENQIAVDPLNWPVIRGTGGIRKARFSRESIGKRGGGRVCYLYLTIYETIYFLSAYAKNDKEDLSEQDKKKMRKLVEQILEAIGGE